MKHPHLKPALRKRSVRHALTWLIPVVAATLLVVSQVEAGGGGGGVEIYPFASLAPPGTGTGQPPATRWITVRSQSGAPQVLPASMQDSGVRVRQHTARDLVVAGPGNPRDWSLDLDLLAPVLRVWEGQEMLSLNGHFVLADAAEGDGEDPRLHNGVDSVKSHLVIILGLRAPPSGRQGVPESFSNVLRVVVLPAPDHMVSLEAARKALTGVLHGAGLDVALGLFSQDGSGAMSQTWASFRTDDARAIYEIESR